MCAASKHAVEGLTRSAALELAKDGIRVNVGAPGPTLTPMLDRVTGGDIDLLASRVPMGRAATDVARRRRELLRRLATSDAT